MSLNCDNGYVPVSGVGNSQSFIPISNGNYACRVYNNQGCVDTTACFNFNSVGIATNTNKLEVSVYPNPSSSIVNITLPPSKGRYSIKLFDAVGRLVYEASTSEETSQIDVSQLASGQYNLVVYNQEQSISKKLNVVR